MSETLATALRRTAGNMRAAAEAYRGSSASETLHAFAKEVEMRANEAEKSEAQA
jgi:hypothetical protein